MKVGTLEIRKDINVFTKSHMNSSNRPDIRLQLLTLINLQKPITAAGSWWVDARLHADTSDFQGVTGLIQTNWITAAAFLLQLHPQSCDY